MKWRFKDFRIFPNPIIKITTTGPQIGRNKDRPAEWTCSLAVTDPPIEASAVEYVAAVSEAADLVVGLELVETDGATIGRVEKVGELDDGENLTEESGGERIEVG